MKVFRLKAKSFSMGFLVFRFSEPDACDGVKELRH